MVARFEVKIGQGIACGCPQPGGIRDRADSKNRGPDGALAPWARLRRLEPNQREREEKERTGKANQTGGAGDGSGADPPVVLGQQERRHDGEEEEGFGEAVAEEERGWGCQ